MTGQNGGKQDVWSLGVLLWEVVTLGGTPYCHMATRDLATRILRGLRLPRAPGLSDQLYQLMLACWMTDPDERPSAEELHLMLADLARSGGGSSVPIFPFFSISSTGQTPFLRY